MRARMRSSEAWPTPIATARQEKQLPGLLGVFRSPQDMKQSMSGAP